MLVSTGCASLSVALVVRAAVELRVVASVDHPSGSHLWVTPKYGVISEPFVTEIFFDDGDGNWRWNYYDHEDSYWGSADCEVIGSEIHVKSPGNRSIQIDAFTDECSVWNAQGRTRCYGKSTRTDARPPALSDSADS